MWKIIGKEDKADIMAMEQFVAGHARGHFMQLPRWASVKSFWDWQGILILRDGGIRAAMSVLIRPLPLGLSMLYAPRGPVGPREDPGVWTELMEALGKLAASRRAILLYLDPDEPDANADFRTLMTGLGFQEKADDGFGNIQPQYVFRLDLNGKEEADLFGAFSSKTRYNIRLAQRKGVVIRQYSGAESIPETVLDSFSDLMAATGQRDHFQIRGKEYFRSLLQALGDDARLFLAEFQGQPIAGTIEIFCGSTAWYLYGASSNQHRSVMPNYLLQWTMIQCALDRGCGLYDFRGVPGAVSENDPLYGLYRFKKGFGGDYTKFTGLFTYAFRPGLAWLAQQLVQLRRRIRIRA